VRSLSMLVTVLAIAAPLTVRAQDPRTTVVRDAQRLAQCTVALDAECVTALSDVAAYKRLSQPDFDFAKSQRGWFDGLKRVGASYARFHVSTQPKVFTVAGRLYAFVPYLRAMHWPGRPVRSVTAYLVGVSADHGQSWKFFDGAQLTIMNAPVIILGYTGSPPLPCVHESTARPVVLSHDAISVLSP
jgi:hypothetical protein